MPFFEILHVKQPFAWHISFLSSRTTSSQVQSPSEIILQNYAGLLISKRESHFGSLKPKCIHHQKLFYRITKHFWFNQSRTILFLSCECYSKMKTFLLFILIHLNLFYSKQQRGKRMCTNNLSMCIIFTIVYGLIILKF